MDVYQYIENKMHKIPGRHSLPRGDRASGVPSWWGALQHLSLWSRSRIQVPRKQEEAT